MDGCNRSHHFFVLVWRESWALEEGCDDPLAGILVMSGYLPHSSAFTISSGLEKTPIFHGHGEGDPLVRLENAEESKSTVMEKGATDYTLKTYSGLAHSVNPTEIADDMMIPRKNLISLFLLNLSRFSVRIFCLINRL